MKKDPTTMRTIKEVPVLFLLVFASFLPSTVARSQEIADEDSIKNVSYMVILKNGQRIPARTKPVSAFGKVRYMQADGTNRVLPISEVDVEKTREANSQTKIHERGGTLSISGQLTTAKSQVSGDTGKKTGDAEKKQNLSVKVYSATWCPYCKDLKSFLAKNKISASITEVDRLPAAEQQRIEAEMKRLTGRVSFPTVVIGDNAQAGFSPSWILKTLGR